MFETQLQSYHNLAFTQGLYSLTLAVCLATASASPIIPPLVPGLAAGTTIALTSAGLVTTSAAGVAVNTVPLAGVALAGGAVLAGGAALAVDKILLIEALRNELNKNNANNRG